MVDILRDASPSEMPYEQASRFELLIKISGQQRGLVSKYPPPCSHVPTLWSNKSGHFRCWCRAEVARQSAQTTPVTHNRPLKFFRLVEEEGQLWSYRFVAAFPTG